MRIACTFFAFLLCLCTISVGCAQDTTDSILLEENNDVTELYADLGKLIVSYVDVVDVCQLIVTVIFCLVTGKRKSLSLSAGQRIATSCLAIVIFAANQYISALFLLSLGTQILFYLLSYGLLIYIVYLWNKIQTLTHTQITIDDSLKKLLNKAHNKRIVSIQVFDITRTKENDLFRYNIKFRSGRSNPNTDINCVMGMNLHIPQKYVAIFELVLQTYQNVVESGSESNIKILRDLIDDTVNEIRESLKCIPDVASINKAHCVLARLMVLFLSIEALIDGEDKGYVGLYSDGLGFAPEIEERLFTLTRTGLLGAILMDSDRIYSFKYRKNGDKGGRKYCTFRISSADAKSDHFSIGLAVVEGDNGDFIRSNVMEAVKKLNSDINTCFHVS